MFHEDYDNIVASRNASSASITDIILPPLSALTSSSSLSLPSSHISFNRNNNRSKSATNLEDIYKSNESDHVPFVRNMTRRGSLISPDLNAASDLRSVEPDTLIILNSAHVAVSDNSNVESPVRRNTSSNDDMSPKQRRQSIQLADTEVPQAFINFEELKSQISNTGQESFSVDI
jgi:hypothetical protein